MRKALASWMSRAGLTAVKGQGPVAMVSAGPVRAALSASGEGGAGYGTLARRGYLGNPVVHRAVRLVAEAAAAVPVVFYEGEAEVSAHPLVQLIGRPNPRMGRADFFETVYSHLMLAGNAYLEPVAVGGEIRALYPIRPDRVRIETDADGWPAALVAETARGSRRLAFTGAPGEPIHLRLFNPLDDLGGAAPLSAAAGAIGLHNAALAWNRALLDNSARPSGALVYQPREGGNLSPQQYERLKQELEEGYSGSMAAGRPLLLEGGLDWKAMSLTPRDMDFIEARNGAARDIALSLGVPPMLIGIQGDNTYSNYQEANRAFYRLTVLPLISRTLEGLVSSLRAPGERLRAEPDIDAVSALAAERGEVWARLEAASFLTLDEKRMAVGYPPAGLSAEI